MIHDDDEPVSFNYLQEEMLRAADVEFGPRLAALDLDLETLQAVGKLMADVSSRAIQVTLVEVNARLVRRGIELDFRFDDEGTPSE